MTRLSFLAAPLCFTALALAAPLAQADPPAAGETADRLNKLERKVADLEVQMKDLLELKKLPARLDDMDRNLSESFKRIGDEIKSLANPPRISKDLPDTATGNTQIQLVNSWDSPVLVVLDGTDYLLQPGRTRTITRRPGASSAMKFAALMAGSSRP